MVGSEPIYMLRCYFMESESKKKLWIFIACAYGVVILLSIFMFIGLRHDYDLSCFVNSQMMYPACGVILGKLITRKKDEKLPMGAYITTLITTAIMIVISILSVFIPLGDLNVSGTTMSAWTLIISLPVMMGSILAYIFFWTCGKDIRKKHGLAHNNMGMSVILVVVFCVLYLGRRFIDIVLTTPDAGMHLWMKDFLGNLINFEGLITLFALPFNYFLTFLPFFGEEYGWRYYLQPIMQKKFGTRIGILLLGVVWGLWHWDADFMFYTKESGIVMLTSQIITCIVIAIFFGYTMMKTNNIWAVVVMHYINNNMAAVFEGSDALQNQSAQWNMIPPFLVASLLFALFILMPLFNKKHEEIPLLAEN